MPNIVRQIIKLIDKCPIRGTKFSISEHKYSNRSKCKNVYHRSAFHSTVIVKRSNTLHYAWTAYRIQHSLSFTVSGFCRWLTGTRAEYIVCLHAMEWIICRYHDREWIFTELYGTFKHNISTNTLCSSIWNQLISSYDGTPHIQSPRGITS
jgi:hypothetical protein